MPTAGDLVAGRKIKERNLFSFLALIIFIASVLLSAGMFGYKYYLKYRIDQMGADLENARATIEPETIRALTRLDNRISSTRELLIGHRAPTLLFEFLEVSTPKTVRFNDFRFSMAAQGLKLSMRGEARGYSALALQADIFSKSNYFQNPTFSDLNLNSKGDVIFSFEAIVDPKLVSYSNLVKRTILPSTTSSLTATST